MDSGRRMAVLEQICLAALDVDNHPLAEKCLAQLRIFVAPAGKESLRFRVLLGRCLEGVGDMGGAEKIYDEILKDFPFNTYVLKRKYCMLKQQVGKEIEAMAALNDYLKQNPADASAWKELSNVCLEMGDYKGAVFALEEVVLSSPLDAKSHCQLAEAYATVGGIANLKLARKHLAQSLELNPTDNRRALFMLVTVTKSYLEAVGKSKRDYDENDTDVAKELIKYGAEKLLAAYKGTTMFAPVQEFLNRVASTPK
eukprot:CAMPEP_0118715516 /NCGR_PEP_ID=MMETSP0800-20121206/26924_1 /TAXON_ID=210618 ORGANISM="Striatella unipunctata, Strain CCMP2910" /NCGR_SAMPLE_ID=MMETSP0800 /ASSEMBLY_ACC=CAM_ASM_000638 /LENGTH=254 /DNA_ID=CAMNT_0006621705 /DNA_START=136 /DNA_END=900 /DNA_ORIENTATION=+